MHGNDNWKWGVVFILLAIFLVTANQAYKHVVSQEDFEPPDDYLKGDSWDIEQQAGETATSPDTETEVQVEPPNIEHKDDIDWDKL
ncbi:MAG: hypothetical protein BWY02_02707 [bacterium ADurb.Bin157]|nr:hypothetical protein [Candidatus Riflebacteria bacterium]OQB44753.1 MAG: hypothetical protein BWY02_02707 [bacterium ADurb.Bin157]